MKYLIVDDHALVAGALTLLLEDRDPEADVHTAATADAALELVDREGDADLLILDLSLPGVTGTELMEEIVRRQPMLKILVVSGLADQESIMRVLQLGAAGFVPKSLDTELLSSAIDFVLKGGVYIPSKLLTESQKDGFFTRTAARLKAPESAPPHLTDRQLDVLAQLAKGAPIFLKEQSKHTLPRSTAHLVHRTAPKRSLPPDVRVLTSIFEGNDSFQKKRGRDPKAFGKKLCGFG